MQEDLGMLREQAQGHFLALADILRDLEFEDIFGRLAELYCDFRDGAQENF